QQTAKNASTAAAERACLRGAILRPGAQWGHARRRAGRAYGVGPGDAFSVLGRVASVHRAGTHARIGTSSHRKGGRQHALDTGHRADKIVAKHALTLPPSRPWEREHPPSSQARSCRSRPSVGRLGWWVVVVGALMVLGQVAPRVEAFDGGRVS